MNQLDLFPSSNKKRNELDNLESFLPFNEASEWASKYLARTVTPSNISYLIQYALINKYYDEFSNTAMVKMEELKEYYDENILKKERHWKEKLGKDLTWALSFDHLREADTTKHIHRLHPYKGKFIPQLVEYFLDDHINTFKTDVFFREGDIILDPFMGSGTTLIQASEMGMHSIGIDISEFNCLISKVKTDNYDLTGLAVQITDALQRTGNFSYETFDDRFDIELKDRISNFNKKHFPNPEFKSKARNDKVFANEYSAEKFRKFLDENNDFLSQNLTKSDSRLFAEEIMPSFLAKWFSERIKQELFFYKQLIGKMENDSAKNVMRIILSRTARSCRATTHSDLATLIEPQIGPYYCRKHFKICTPVNSILKHLRKNTNDTPKRLDIYSKLKKGVNISIIHGDSCKINIFEEIRNQNFYNLLIENKISGIFTSPTYVGQIEYHEQHAYAYELFEINRQDEKEIGPLFRGKSKQAKKEYIEGISEVLINISKYVRSDGNYFIVANDKHNLYPEIAERSNLQIVNEFKRPVLNRTERDRQPYSEIIFQMQKI